MTDQTVITFATSLTDFHELELSGTSVRRAYTVSIVAALLIGLVSTGLLASSVLTQWMPVAAVWKWATGSILLGVALSCLISSTFIPGKLREVLVFSALLGLICSSGTLITALGWSSSAARAAIVKNGIVPLTTMPLALGDTSDIVAATTCHTILTSEHQVGRDHVLPALSARPSLAGHCLQRGHEPSEEVALTLLQGWTRMIYGTDDVDEAVRYAEALSTLPLPSFLLDAALIECSAGAPFDRVARSCASRLQATIDQRTWPDRLEAASGSLGPNGSRAVMSMAFNASQHTSALHDFAAAVDASGDAARLSALRALSTIIDSGHWNATKEVTAGACDLTTDLPHRPTLWNQLIIRVIDRHTDHKVPVQTALCAEFETALVTLAVEDASRLVAAANRAPRQEESRGIDSGWLMNNPETSQTLEDLQTGMPAGLSHAEQQHWLELQKHMSHHRNNPLIQ